MKMKLPAQKLSLFLALCLTFSLAPCCARPARASAPQPQSYTISIPIAAAWDDLEEWLSTGQADVGSNDLELGLENPGAEDPKPQIVGLRFINLPILSGATITAARIQFTVDEAKYPGDPFDVSIFAEAAADSAPFGDGDTVPPHALSSRTQTEQSVRWASDQSNKIVWKRTGQAGKAQQTPDLSPLVQAVVDTEGWAYGNAMTFLFTGTGNRTAYAFERSSKKAPVLQVSYTAFNAGQAAPEGLTGTAPTTLFQNDGAINGTTARMEYRRADGKAAQWTPCGDADVTGLAAGDYEVRYAAILGYDPGAATCVNLPLYAGDLTLQPGADETEMNFTWYVNDPQAKESVLQIAPASAATGGGFPAEAAASYMGKPSKVRKSFFSNEISVTGLAPDTEYVYRVGNGTNWSTACRFCTRNAQNYTALFVGDPQIGSGSGGGTSKDSRGWQATLTQALTSFPATSFILCAGDQVEYWSNEKQYAAFFSPAELRRVPFVPTIGNHDNGTLFASHFNPPNESTVYGRSRAGCDYWFTYGNTLYMVLNSNNRSVTTHDAFLKEATQSAGDGIVWKVVMFHHSIYSSAAHSLEDCITYRRDELYPLMDKYGIDVALMGHDHRYTRTYQMLGGKAQNGLESFAVNPSGTLYVTAGSASGSKYYNMQGEDTPYRAMRWEGKDPTYCNITVGDSAFTITTYLSKTNEMIDRYTIIKDLTAPAFLRGVAPTAADGDDGSILGTTAGMEYRDAAASGWTACTGTAVTGLRAGVYAVRYRGTETRAPGMATTIAVPGPDVVAAEEAAVLTAVQ